MVTKRKEALDSTIKRHLFCSTFSRFRFDALAYVGGLIHDNRLLNPHPSRRAVASNVPHAPAKYCKTSVRRELVLYSKHTLDLARGNHGKIDTRVRDLCFYAQILYLSYFCDSIRSGSWFLILVLIRNIEQISLLPRKIEGTRILWSLYRIRVIAFPHGPDPHTHTMALNAHGCVRNLTCATAN